MTSWLSGWSYRREIDITSQSDLTDYQIRVDLDSNNFDFSKANSDGSDIRFTGDDGTTLLNYWIEKWDSTNSEGVLWVKVPSVSGSSTTTIYLYYGNSSASDASSGDDTFIFFDDFNGTSLDTNKWSTYTSGNSSITLDNGLLRLYTDSGNENKLHVYAKNGYGYGQATFVYMEIESGGYETYFALSDDTNYNAPNGDYVSSCWINYPNYKSTFKANNLWSDASSSIDLISPSLSTFYRVEIRFDTSKEELIWVDGNSYDLEIGMENVEYKVFFGQVSAWNKNMSSNIDYVAQRNFIFSEPTISIGDETEPSKSYTQEMDENVSTVDNEFNNINKINYDISDLEDNVIKYLSLNVLDGIALSDLEKSVQAIIQSNNENISISDIRNSILDFFVLESLKSNDTMVSKTDFNIILDALYSISDSKHGNIGKSISENSKISDIINYLKNLISVLNEQINSVDEYAMNIGKSVGESVKVGDTFSEITKFILDLIENVVNLDKILKNALFHVFESGSFDDLISKKGEKGIMSEGLSVNDSENVGGGKSISEKSTLSDAKIVFSTLKSILENANIEDLRIFNVLYHVLESADISDNVEIYNILYEILAENAKMGDEIGGFSILKSLLENGKMVDKRMLNVLYNIEENSKLSDEIFPYYLVLLFEAVKNNDGLKRDIVKGFIEKYGLIDDITKSNSLTRAEEMQILDKFVKRTRFNPILVEALKHNEYMVKNAVSLISETLDLYDEYGQNISKELAEFGKVNDDLAQTLIHYLVFAVVLHLSDEKLREFGKNLAENIGLDIQNISSHGLMMIEKLNVNIATGLMTNITEEFIEKTIINDIVEKFK